MEIFSTIFTVLVLFLLFLVLPGFKVVQQYEKGVVFRFGKIISSRDPGLNWIIPYIDRMQKIDFRTITLPIPAQKIITKDNVSVDISAVAYYKIVDAEKSIVAIADVMNQRLSYSTTVWLWMPRAGSCRNRSAMSSVPSS